MNLRNTGNVITIKPGHVRLYYGKIKVDGGEEVYALNIYTSNKYIDPMSTKCDADDEDAIYDHIISLGIKDPRSALAYSNAFKELAEMMIQEKESEEK